MVPSHVKIGQRWAYRSSYDTRIEEVISIEQDRTASKIRIVQCTPSDPSLNKEYNESNYYTSEWTLLEGQEVPSI
jgi:hypothetical protein